MKRAALALFVCAVVSLADVSIVSADHPSGYNAFPYFGTGYYGTYRSLYGLGRLPVPPYYALHPPVYYSRPVARTYGTNPFVCPCKDYEAEEHPTPEVIENPHYVPKAAPTAAPTEGETARLILNPFVGDAAQLATSE